MKVLLLYTVALFAKVYGQCPLLNGFFAHETNCDMYYQCINGTQNVGICPDGLVFDNGPAPNKLRCDLPYGIDCSLRQSLQPPMAAEHCPRQWGLFPHETDCNRYWSCVDGNAFAFTCPEGLAYNQYNGQCDWPDKVENCNSEVLLKFVCPVPSESELQYFGVPRYPYSGDCRKLLACIVTVEGLRMPRLLSCDPGYVFNPVTSSCDFPENVAGCQNYYFGNVDQRGPVTDPRILTDPLAAAASAAMAVPPMDNLLTITSQNYYFGNVDLRGPVLDPVAVAALPPPIPAYPPQMPGYPPQMPGYPPQMPGYPPPMPLVSKR